MARTVLSTKHLYALLAKSPDRPSISTVKRWVEGKQEMPSWVLGVIAESLGMQISPPQSFDWSGLVEKLDAVVVAVDARVGETPEQRVARLAVEGTGEPPPQSGGDESTGRGRRAPVRPRPGVRPGR